MIRHVVIITPAPVPTGPIKGAYALANAIVAERPVTLVTIKAGPGVDAPLDSRVRVRSLAGVTGHWRGRLAAYRQLLAEAGGRDQVASVSMCLSADAVNWWCRGQAVTCASVRGNLLRNYRLDYGAIGLPVAAGHLSALRRFDHVVALTAAMADQVARYTGKRPVVIPNFLDEPPLERFRHAGPPPPPMRFVFVGSLTPRKQPLLLLSAMAELRRQRIEATLDLVGDGPLASQVARECTRLGLDGRVVLHGHLREPHAIVAAAHAMVLPSLSEGAPRAALEALHLGVPCVLRRADGNAELVADSTIGALFDDDRQLADTMLRVAQTAHAPSRQSLLPAAFRQQAGARRYLELLDGR